MAGLSAQEELILLRKRARRRLVGAVVLVLIATGVLWKVVGHVPEPPMKPESVIVVGESASGAVSKAPGSERPVVASTPVEASQPDTTALPESLSSVTQPLATQPPAQKAAETAKNKPGANSAVEANPPVAADASAARSKRKLEAKAKAKAKLDAVPPLEKPRKKPDPAAILEGRADATDSSPTAAPTAGAGKVIIQLAALSDPAKVEALRNKLDSVGVSARFSKVQTSKGEATRVRVGPFASRAEADATLKKLSRAGVSGIIVSLHTP